MGMAVECRSGIGFMGIGKESADIAKTAIKTGASVRDVLRSKNIMSEEEIDKLLDPATMV